MSYLVVRCVTTANGTEKDVVEKEIVQDAVILYHQTMASMMTDANVLTGFCTILDEYGRQGTEFTEYYEKPVPKPETVE